MCSVCVYNPSKKKKTRLLLLFSLLPPSPCQKKTSRKVPSPPPSLPSLMRDHAHTHARTQDPIHAYPPPNPLLLSLSFFLHTPHVSNRTLRSLCEKAITFYATLSPPLPSPSVQTQNNNSKKHGSLFFLSHRLLIFIARSPPSSPLSFLPPPLSSLLGGRPEDKSA